MLKWQFYLLAIIHFKYAIMRSTINPQKVANVSFVTKQYNFTIILYVTQSTVKQIFMTKKKRNCINMKLWWGSVINKIQLYQKWSNIVFLYIAIHGNKHNTAHYFGPNSSY